MKKKELLYRAVGNLDDGTVNDAMEHEVECRDHSRLFAVLEGVAIVAVVCGLIAFSFVLMKFAGEKTDPRNSDYGADVVGKRKNTRLQGSEFGNAGYGKA